MNFPFLQTSHLPTSAQLQFQTAKRTNFQVTPTVNEKSSNEDDVNTKLFQTTFSSITKFGIKAVHALCVAKINEQIGVVEEIVNSITSVTSEDVELINLLCQLSQEDASKVAEMIEALRNNTMIILAPLKGCPWERQREIIIYSDNSDEISNLNHYQIVAKAGVIYLKQINEVENKEAPLMSTAEFLTCFKVDLGRLNLGGMELNEVNLNNSTLNKTILSCASLKLSNLSNSTLNKVYLNGSDLRWANLSGVKMNGVYLSDADFSDANLSGAILNDVMLQGTKLSGANLQDTVINLTLPEVWNRNLLNTELIPLMNSIKTICDEHIVLKINLMHQIIDSLSTTSVLSVREAFLTIFCSNSAYIKDEKIASFIHGKILNDKITEANTAELKVCGVLELCLFLTAVNLTGNKKEQFMLENNGFFVQLISLCMETKNPDILEPAALLYDEYLSLGPLAGYKEEISDYGCDDLRDSDENSVAYVFYTKIPPEELENSKQNEYTLLITKKNIHDMLHSSPGHCWSQIYLRKNGDPVIQSEMNLTYLFEQFKLFNEGYKFHLNQSTFSKLLDTINLNYVNSKVDSYLTSKDYRPLFREALNKPRFDVKLTDIDDQERLRKIFKPLFIKGTNNIKEEHFNQILEMFDLTEENPTTQAQTIFCLAALFVTYSSSYYFGEEGDSPAALRHYAAVLITKAHELDMSIFIDADGKDQFDDWINKLLVGKDGAFTCTAELGAVMKEQAIAQGFDSILVQMKPIAWL